MVVECHLEGHRTPLHMIAMSGAGDDVRHVLGEGKARCVGVERTVVLEGRMRRGPPLIETR